MTPTQPPNSPDGGKPLPPRHRPSLSELSKDTTELDLWAFDEDLEGEDSNPVELPRSPTGDLPAPRERRVVNKGKADDAGASDQVRMNVAKQRPTAQKASISAGIGAKLGDFDDLESWEDSADVLPLEELPSETQPATPSVADDTTPENPAAAGVESMAAESITSATEAEDEFSPHKRPEAQPASLRPRLNMSGVERLGMLALVALLIAGGVFAYVFSLLRLPTEGSRAKTNDFPIKGEKMVIDAADTYWRQPIFDGPEADTIRRGTQLLPVIKLQIPGGSGAVRVFFRNEDRLLIGDAVTRTVDGATTLRIAATAGFDDLGMHAAYRTGGSKPWTAEVFEAASVNSPGRDFKRLFEMDISTARR